MDSKIKVGSFIQLPTANNFKPSKKKKNADKAGQRAIANNPFAEQAPAKAIVPGHKPNPHQQTADARSSASQSSGQPHTHEPFRRQTTKLNDEDQQKQLNAFEFFVNKVRSIYNKELVKLKYRRHTVDEQLEREICSVMPPFELFIQDQIDPETRIRKFFSYLEDDDYLIGYLVTSSSSASKSETKKVRFKLICFDGSKRRLLHDLDLYAYYLLDDDEASPALDDLTRKNEGKNFRFKVSKVIKEQVFVTFSHRSDHDNLFLSLGLIGFDELPEHFRKVMELKQRELNDKSKEPGAIYNFDDLLHANRPFRNPSSVDYLLENLQIECGGDFFKNKLFEKHAVAGRPDRQANEDLRLGIEFLRREQFEKAELCLNRAIESEPNNSDAHTAKGCLLANRSRYAESIEEFEIALKLNDKHTNARKYLIETLTAKGRDLIKQKSYSNALDFFRKLLLYDKRNQEAMKAIRTIEDKLATDRKSSSKRTKSPSSKSSDSSKRRHL